MNTKCKNSNHGDAVVCSVYGTLLMDKNLTAASRAHHALALWSDRIQDTPEIPENKKIRSINLYF